jgi:hypothetical protein
MARELKELGSALISEDIISLLSYHKDVEPTSKPTIDQFETESEIK